MITININKAKTIAHEIRRTSRAVEFAPLDVKATIPSEAVAVEVSRQAVRDKYTAIQNNIEAASSVEEIKAALA